MGDLGKRDYQYKLLKRSADYAVSGEFGAANVDTLKARYKYLLEVWKKFSHEHELVAIGAKTNDEVAAHDVLYEQAEKMFFDTCAAIQGRIRSFEEEHESHVSQVGGGPQVNQQALVQAEVSAAELRSVAQTCGIFDGNYANWHGFRDRYLVAVHNNARYADVFKLQVLKLVLKGSAERVLGTWQPTEANYVPAWERVNEVYNDEYQIVQAHLLALHNMPRMHKASNDGLRSLIDTTNEVVRQLGTLRVPVDQWDQMLVFMLVQRLDEQTAESWEMQRDTTHLPTLKEMLEFLEKRARVMTYADAVAIKGVKAGASGTPGHTGGAVTKSAAAQERNKSANERFRNKANKTESTPSRESSRTREKKQMKCHQCAGNHPLYKCNDFLQLSIAGRTDLVTRWGLCINCFGTGHYKNNCDQGPCRCGIKHNSVLCGRVRSVVNVVTNTIEPSGQPMDSEFERTIAEPKIKQGKK